MPKKKKSKSKSKSRGGSAGKEKVQKKIDFPEEAIPDYIPPPPVTGHQVLDSLRFYQCMRWFSGYDTLLCLVNFYSY